MMQKKGAIRCPKDKKEFQVANAADLPNNFGMIEMLEEMQINDPPQDTPAKGQAGGEAEPLCKDHNQVIACVCVGIYIYIYKYIYVCVCLVSVPSFLIIHCNLGTEWILQREGLSAHGMS